MGLVDDFLLNNTPEVPPTDDSIRVQKLVDLDNLPPQAQKLLGLDNLPLQEKNPNLTAYSGKEQSEDKNTETIPPFDSGTKLSRRKE